MFQPREEQDSSLLTACLSCLGALLRCLCCLDTDGATGDRGQQLLSTHQESLAIEAAASPHLPIGGTGEQGPLLKGHGPSSSSLPRPSPPMPPPFFPPTVRHKRGGSDSSRRGGGGGGSPMPAGASPKAAARPGGKLGKADGGSRLSLFEDEDICPTCLDPYTEDNPRVLTRCNHHFHLPCLYEWLERSETCPVCSKPMQFEEIV